MADQPPNQPTTTQNESSDINTPSGGNEEAATNAADVGQKQILRIRDSDTAGMVRRAEGLFVLEGERKQPGGKINVEQVNIEIDEATMADMELQLSAWRRQAIILRSIHGFLTFAATVCSFLVAAKSSDERYRDYIPWLSFGAAVSIGLLSAFDLGSKANRLRRAWRILRIQIFRYKQKKVAGESVIAMYALAEELIGDVREEPK